MALTLHVDGDRWRAHLSDYAGTHSGLVPVAKGNGYGFGNARLARKAGWLGVDTLAVGTYAEVEAVASRFDGSVLVLTPWRPSEAPERADPRVVHTVGRLEDLAALAGTNARVVLELVTSMLRHGFTAAQLRAAADVVRRGDLRCEGVAIHLPLASGSHLGEVDRLVTDVVAAGLPSPTLWVSHLTDSELATLRTRYQDLTVRPRVGTALWLGDRAALRVGATVLDTHAVERGDIYGYRGRTAPRAGTIVVVSGGTAHGIGLEAPTGENSLRAKAATVARGGLDAAGFTRSPFEIDGKQRLFAEPPHMQASMLFLPAGAAVPEIGDEVGVRVRFTATTFDRTEIS